MVSKASSVKSGRLKRFSRSEMSLSKVPQFDMSSVIHGDGGDTGLLGHPAACDEDETAVRTD